MALRSQRFGVRNAVGGRSSEWVVMWKTNSSDVYLVTRTLGGSMKASLHASGRCHVRAPDSEKWRGQGEPPRFLEVWEIDVDSQYQFPFAVVVPEQELRVAEWAKYRDKGTIWIDAPVDKGVEVAIFLVRAEGDLSTNLNSAGWHTIIVDAALPDGRRLLVAVGDATITDVKLAELEQIRLVAKRALATSNEPVGNPRILMLAGANEQGTRKFVEVAVLE